MNITALAVQPPTDGETLYNQNCLFCHGDPFERPAVDPRISSGVRRYITGCAGCHGYDARGGFVGEGMRGESGGEIREAIFDENSMRFMRRLPSFGTNQIGNYRLGLDDDRRGHDDSDE